MKRAIDFYFDFASPYGYFASMRIEQLASKYGRMVAWHPVLLGVVFRTTGGAPLTAAPLKGAYAVRDFERTARFHGIPYQQPPVFPVATQIAARGMLWVRQTQGDDKAVEFAKAVYHAYFCEGVNTSEPESIARIASAIGLDAAALLDGANSAEIRDRMKADVEAAMARGVFGSPFIFVEDEPFWGFDRFDQIEACLKDGKI
jgi:2-hydroxychromene-2-carboxylate isomerase